MKMFYSKTAFTAALAAVVSTFAATGSATPPSSAPESNSASSAFTAFGLAADNELVRFSTANPRRERQIGYVSGLTVDTTLVGIDFRVQDRRLYGVGNAGGIYTIDTRYATAKLVDRLDIALDGTSFGVDFNPAADALRVVSDTGQNLRHPFAAGPTQFVTQLDAFLRYPPPVGVTPTAATGIGAAAYTNNDLDLTTGTTLFDIDLNLDQVVIQSPANSGNLAATGLTRVDATGLAGFDIVTKLSRGRASRNSGFTALKVGNSYGLYAVNLLTGSTRLIGKFDHDVFDIAIRLDK
jgi:hypothetical protein